ncbi:pyrroline-5-carboxylate reductase [Oleiagrimonas sp.]|jgi:pyrroline-5-carboxylate reductase|uniref:pyrroline-5-carboxylate reductase n=1 Tax=Oleiagrimonas sp. TaxID=2010330 RepID=UPI00260DD0C3|nr:pyrroline-5-carboxylate reductase [Oleiagrimonas sp.]MDA3914356.1 pyrroline-5-carboxylate reductase [Oleiagrimonas sp.]
MHRITFIGGGNMARSLVGGLISKGTEASAIAIAEPRPEARQALEHDFGVTTFAEGMKAVDGAEIVVLAVKPQVLPGVCGDLAEIIARDKPLVVSIAAGIRTDQLERWLGDTPAIVRCMPNTPSLIGAGATGLFANAQVSDKQKQQAEDLLETAGLTAWIEDESQIDTVTGISGSAPAYYFLMVEALEDAAVARGLPRETARKLAAQTCMGAGRMMVEGNESPDALRKRVTSPNGTTQAALESFAADGLRQIVARAVDACATRGAELASDND